MSQEFNPYFFKQEKGYRDESSITSPINSISVIAVTSTLTTSANQVLMSS